MSHYKKEINSTLCWPAAVSATSHIKMVIIYKFNTTINTIMKTPTTNKDNNNI